MFHGTGIMRLSRTMLQSVFVLKGRLEPVPWLLWVLPSFLQH